MKDPKYNTSLYNHKPLCDNGKPLISNLEYKLLVEAVTSGNIQEYEKAKQIYTFEPKQQKYIEDYLNNRIL